MFGERRLFAFARSEPVEFDEAMGQLLGVDGVAGVVAFEPREAFLGGAPGGPGEGACLRHARTFAEGVQKRAVGARVQEAHALVLTMHLHQEVAHLA